MQRKAAEEGGLIKGGADRRNTLTKGIGILAVAAGILVSSCLGYRNMAREQQRLSEAEQLRMAASKLFHERVAQEKEEMEFFTEVYWLDIGDKDHPFFGSCPSSWEDGGRITGMTITDDGELTEIIYQGSDGSREIWIMTLTDQCLKVEVVRN